MLGVVSKLITKVGGKGSGLFYYVKNASTAMIQECKNMAG